MNLGIITPFLDKMVKDQASDLFLTVGSAPSVRIEDKIYPLPHALLTQEDLNVMMEELLTADQKEEFESSLELNIALMTDNRERFRVNFFRQQHQTGMVVRHIRSKIPTLEMLSLASAYADAVMLKRGLVLMVGPTGSGKSTSLAAMLNHRNHFGGGHIITIEDPIEFVHEPKNCLFTQREIGIDTYSYGIALKNALRQSPDVIVIGEIRDRETLENALLFCETGHLVIATMHANNSVQTIERIANLFPEEMQQQVLMTMAQNLKMIISQRLVEGKTGGRELAFEVLINEGLIKVLIEEGKVKDIKQVIEKSRDRGMQTIDQSLLELLEKGKITIEVALHEADNPSNLKLRISQDKNIASTVKAGNYEIIQQKTFSEKTTF